MKKTYPIEVDCPNCALKMEEAAGHTQGVAAASINFMAQKMTVEFEPGSDPMETMQQVLKACRKVEPDCSIDF